MDLVTLLDDADPVSVLVAVLERLSDADRMEFARTARIPHRRRDEPQARSEEAQRAERAFDDLHHDGSVTDGYGHYYFDPGGYGHYSEWLDARDLIGEAAEALSARDRERVTILAHYFRDLG
jgi:hypothetical protein